MPHPPRNRMAWLTQAVCVGALLAAAMAHAAPATGPPKLPKPEQLEAQEAFVWNGGLVVRVGQSLTWSFATLSLDSATVRPLEIPGLDRIADLATFAGQPVAVGARGPQLGLMALRSGAWRTLPLPAGVKGPDGLRLAASEQFLAVVQWNGTTHWLAGGTWRTRVGAFPHAVADHLVIVGTKLYVAYSARGWGGGLYALALDSGAPQTLIPADGCTASIAALERGPDGNLWVLESAPGVQGGRLRTLGEAGWSTLAATAGPRGRQRGPVDPKAGSGCCPDCFAPVRWPLPATPLEGLAFAGDGRPVLLGRDVGPVRLDGDTWKPLVSRWPYKGSWTFLRMAGDTALLGTARQGLLLWHLDGAPAQLVSVAGLGTGRRGEMTGHGCDHYTGVAGGQLQALHTALMDFSALLAAEAGAHSRPLLGDYEVRVRAAGDTLEVEFRAHGTAAGHRATYTLRPPFLRVERREPAKASREAGGR